MRHDQVLLDAVGPAGVTVGIFVVGRDVDVCGRDPTKAEGPPLLLCH